jgi:hypothetical protein
MLSSLGKVIAEPDELRWGCGVAPVSRQISGVNFFSCEILRKLSDS